MKPRLNIVIVFLIAAAFVLGALLFTLHRLQPTWTIRIGDGTYGLEQLKSFTFLFFNHSRIEVTPVINWIPIALVSVAAVVGLLSGSIKYSNRLHHDRS